MCLWPRCVSDDAETKSSGAAFQICGFHTSPIHPICKGFIHGRCKAGFHVAANGANGGNIWRVSASRICFQ